MKCSKCKKEHDAFGGHICAGRTVAAISTDAIKYCIKWVSPEIPKKDYKGNMPSIAREQLAALISENSQLKARVQDCESVRSMWQTKCVTLELELKRYEGHLYISAEEHNKRISTLQHQLDDMQTKSDERDKKIIDEAQRYGYALRVWVNDNISLDGLHYKMTYDEAAKARYGKGIKK
jgi:hypothetical protein